MSLKRYAAKRDANEPEVVEALLAIGASVIRLDQPLDLLVGYQGQTFLIDVKSDKGKLTPAQITFLETWQGGKAGVVRSAMEGLVFIGAIEGE